MAEASPSTSHSNFSEDLSAELETLASIFTSEGEFRVERLGATGDGDYCCIVQVRPLDLAVGLQFTLPVAYPAATPRVEIIPREGDKHLPLDDPRLTEMLEVLYQSAWESVGEPVMYNLVANAKEWMDGKTIGEEEEEEEDATDKDSETRKHFHKDKKKPTHLEGNDEDEESRKKGKNKNKKKKELDDDLGPSKKPRMKTASEVISRIQWDKQIRQEDFTVGYLDRFVGIIEKPFTAFSWVDISTVDDYVTLAIPRHRIQYFKYKDEVVWNRAERLDNVFGSTGSGKTILHTVEVFSKENASMEEKEAGDEVQAAEEKIPVDVAEVVAASAVAPPKPKRSLNRPNHFFAVRISDPIIHRCAKRIQNAVCDEEPRLEGALTDLSSLHITLCTLRLDNEQDILTATGVLTSLRESIITLLAPLTTLHFRGIGQFYDRVLFATPEFNPALFELSEVLQVALTNAGVKLLGNHAKFNPHLTLIKMTRYNSSEFRNLLIKPELYKNFSRCYIGTQNIDAIHLCSMVNPHQEDGFYSCLATLDVKSK